MKEKRYMREFLRDMGKYYPIDMDQAEKYIKNYKRGLLSEIETMRAIMDLALDARDVMFEEYEKECAID